MGRCGDSAVYHAGDHKEIADFALPSIDDEMALFGDASEEIDRFAKRHGRVSPLSAVFEDLFLSPCGR